MLRSFLRVKPRELFVRNITRVTVERPGDEEKMFNLMTRRLRDDGVIKHVRGNQHHVKGSVKRVKRREHKEHLMLKSKVQGLLEWVEFKQKYRVD